MARLNDDTNRNMSSSRNPKKNPSSSSVNIAGDFSTGEGLDIEPSEPTFSRDELRSNGNGGIQFDDQVPASDRRASNEKATLDSLKSATGQSSFGQEAGRKLVNPIPEWPADE